MFSGIVQSLGTIVSISEAGEIVTLEVQATEDFTKDLKVGDSVAVDGVCTLHLQQRYLQPLNLL